MQKAAKTVTHEAFDWLGVHLRGEPSTRRSPVRVYMVNDGWLEMPEWPPRTSERVLYLQPGGALSAAARAEGSSSFRYDPAEPTPTLGGRVMSDAGGYRDDSSLARRGDVLAFTTEPLNENLDVVGMPAVELSHGSDNPHADLFVRLSEVDGEGHSRNVTDGFRRLPPSQGADTVRVQLDGTAHRFPAGSRIRLMIAGGSHPRFARNNGTGEPPLTAVRLLPAVHTVYFGSSRLVLPVN
jgi:putative CocE/NonD family hydrolase